MNYWLERWVDYYRHAILLAQNNVLFISNDLLRRDPAGIEEQILRRIGLSPVRHDVELARVERNEGSSSDAEISQELLLEAKEIFKELESIAFHKRFRRALANDHSQIGLPNVLPTEIPAG